MKVKYAVLLHFDSCSGLSYEVDARTAGGRHERCDSQQRWWHERRTLLERYVFPALKRQSFENFDVWGLFCDRTKKLRGPVEDLFRDVGYNIAYLGDESLRKHYVNRCDFLVLIHNDSDDMYGENAFLQISKVKPERGLMMYFEDGYIYGVNDGRLFDMTTSDKPHGPPPYFAGVYTNASLKSKQNWAAYRKRFKFNRVHHQLGRCPNRHVLPSGHFLGTVHGANTTRSWENKNLIKRLGDEITGEERLRILEGFGIYV